MFLNGKRAESAYGLSDLVGEVITRSNQAGKRAAAGLARRAVPAVSREVRSAFNVRASALAGKYKAVTTPATLRIFAFQRRLPLIEFGARWGGPASAGATASVVRGQRKTYQSAFIADLRGTKRVMARKLLSNGLRAGRLPINTLYGPSPADMFTGRAERGGPIIDAARSVRNNARRELLQFYVEELRRQLKLKG